jgi:catalase (peroxidase I)
LGGQVLDPNKNNVPQDGPDMIMLYSDLALFRDPKFKEIAEIYASDQEAFFTDFAEAFGKLLRRSLNQDQSVVEIQQDSEIHNV